MIEREELKAEIKAVVKRLQPYEVEALAAHLEQVGFRKTLELGELERWEYGAHGHGDGDTLDRATGVPDDRDLVKLSQVRRLAAPKERWVPVTELPETMNPVSCIRGKRRFIGMLVGRFQLEMDTDGDGEWSEDGETFYAAPGWVEQAMEHDDYAWWSVDPPDHWRELPPPPTTPAQTAKDKQQ